MGIREVIINNFNIDLPISCGTGNSLANPIVLEKTEINDYVNTEYVILKYIGLLRGIEWKLIQQENFEIEGHVMDKIKIETKFRTETEIVTQIENYYFDITECVNRD